MAKDYINLDETIFDVWQKQENISTSPNFGKKLFLSKLIFEILKETNYSFGFHPTPVEVVRKKLGLDISYEKKLLTDAEYLDISYRKKLSENAKLYEINNVSVININIDQVRFGLGISEFNERGRFSLAHELGHFIIRYISNKFPEINEKYKFTQGNIEKLCDFIASEFLLPSEFIKNISLKELQNKLKSQSYLNLDADILSEKYFLLNIKVIESLRNCFDVSRFVILQQLHKSRILNEAECGFIISFFNIDRKTKRYPALRVYFAATPSWSFIPVNIKLSSLGLHSAINAFNEHKYNTALRWKEKINIQEKERNKWNKNIAINSEGEHILYQFSKNTNYLITSFKCENPEKIVHQEGEK